MKKTSYFAIFEPSTSGYGVYFPDLPGCISAGETFEKAMEGAQEALGLHLWNMETDGDAIPASTQPPFADMPEGAVVVPVTIYPEMVRNEMETKAVRTNVSLPYWLKAAADKQAVNYSAVLQSALREVLGIHARQ